MNDTDLKEWCLSQGVRPDVFHAVWPVIRAGIFRGIVLDRMVELNGLGRFTTAKQFMPKTPRENQKDKFERDRVIFRSGTILKDVLKAPDPHKELFDLGYMTREEAASARLETATKRTAS